MVVRRGTAADAEQLHALILAHLSEGHLLARDQAEIARHADRFVVVIADDRLVGCADLAPLSGQVAEVRSLVVTCDARSLGIGKHIIDALIQRASDEGFEKVCAFTHSPGYFIRMGFSIVPHGWLPEKIAIDCRTCSHFRQCGQYAVMLTLGAHGQRIGATPIHG